ncbi:protein FAM200C-like [Palaemon carinicauda]|uniref:protein FAM200C-like n=1 Tax=Palaemon carinicauda TaxID=392227 RepID=UPI0035B57583
MLGNKSGFAALVKERVPDIITKHCVLHRHALAVKTLPSHFKEILSVCVKVVNYIWGRALNHRGFKLFCEEMGSEHQVLLFHIEVRWLSRGKMLTRIAELADEIAIFLREHQKKVEAFKKKISLWKHRIQGGNVESFPILDEKHGDKTFQPMLVENIVAHLSLLETTMAQYFPMDHSFPEWIQQPFLADRDDDDNLKEEVIDLQVNQLCQTKFRTLLLSGFWCDQFVAYPGLAKAVLEMFIPFPTTYLCEKAFSTMFQIKTTARNRLQIGLLHDMRMALANKKPQIEKLVAYK